MTNPKPILSRLRELQSKRTQGEWSWHIHGGDFLISNVNAPDRKLVIAGDLQFYNVPFDAEFIAASANLMGDLLDVVEAAKNYLEPVVYGYDASDAYEARCEETRRYETLKAALAKLEQP